MRGTSKRDYFYVSNSVRVKLMRKTICLFIQITPVL